MLLCLDSLFLCLGYLFALLRPNVALLLATRPKRTQKVLSILHHVRILVEHTRLSQWMDGCNALSEPSHHIMMSTEWSVSADDEDSSTVSKASRVPEF